MGHNTCKSMGVVLCVVRRANFKMAAVKSIFSPKCIIEHGFLKFRITSTV